MELYEILARTEIFKNINEEEIKHMLGCLNPRYACFEKDAPILQEGEPATSIGVLLSGKAELVYEDENGGRAMLFPVKAGDVFADDYACSNASKVPASCFATTECEAAFFPYDKMSKVCDRACGCHSTMIQNLLSSVAEKNRRLYVRLMITSRKTTREKLMAYLKSEAEKNDSKYFQIPFNRQELADYLNVDRSAMSAELSKMQKDGLIEYKKNLFRFL